MAGIVEVAKRAGVSPATVSRTFTSPELLKADTQQRVLEAARQLNYTPKRDRNPNSASLQSAHALNSVGFQFFSAEPADMIATNPFYAGILSGAQAEAASLGLHLLLHTTDRHSMSRELPRMIVDRAVSGMLLVGTADPAVLKTFEEHVPHIVLVDNKDSTGTFESVVSDGYGGTREAARYLLGLGHRRIGFVMSGRNIASFQDRMHGLFRAQLEACVPFDPNLVVAGSTVAETELLLYDFLRSPERPTAIIAANDKHALSVMKVCRELGLKIPGDLSVIGFDDVQFATHASPPLTTVHVDRNFMGRLAMRRLHAQMTGVNTWNTETPAVMNIVSVKLVHRDSCMSI